MSRWFRLHVGFHRHPKVVGLNDRDFRMWIELLSIAAENDGVIPPLDVSKRLLSGRLDGQQSSIKRLVRAGLVDDYGDHFRPHNWEKRQYITDTSTDRVRKFRAKRNVSETLHVTRGETPPEQIQSQNIPLPNGKGLESPILEVPVFESPDLKLYRRGKEVLGPNSGGQIKRLRDAVGGDIALTRAALETASTKHDPAAYIGGVIRSRSRESCGAADDRIS